VLLSLLNLYVNLLVVRPRSCRVIYYFDTPALGRRHQSFGHVIHSATNNSLFIYASNSVLCYCLVYVDDIIITGSVSTFVADTINKLSHTFSVKDMGHLHFFLSIEAIPTAKGLFLSQHKYIRDLLSKTSMDMAKDIHTPMSTSTPLILTNGSAPPNSTEYRRVIGALQYLGLTRPDIAFAVNRLSQFMHKPTACHWTAAKRILRYLKQTMFHGILIQQSSPFNLHTFVDADCATNTDTRVSTTAFITFLGSNPISWSARKQRVVSHSSTEAEFVH